MSLDIGAEFTRDASAEVDGVWENIGGDAEILVAAWENPHYMKELRSIPRALRRRLDAGRVSPEEDRELMCRIVAKTVLLGWKNIQRNGKDLPYSTEAAEKSLFEIPRFYNLVVELALEEGRFLASEREDAVKN